MPTVYNTNSQLEILPKEFYKHHKWSLQTVQRDGVYNSPLTLMLDTI